MSNETTTATAAAATESIWLDEYAYAISGNESINLFEMSGLPTYMEDSDGRRVNIEDAIGCDEYAARITLPADWRNNPEQHIAIVIKAIRDMAHAEYTAIGDYAWGEAQSAEDRASFSTTRGAM
jgi:hypothetical protein